MKDLRNFVSNTLVYGLGRGIGKFVGLFLMPFYTRALTPADYGILESLGVGVFFVTAVFNLGLDSASGRFFFMAKTSEEKGTVLFTVFVFRLATVIPTLVLTLFSGQISWVLFGTESYSWAVFLSLMVIPLQLLFSEQEHIFRYFFEPWKFNFVTLTKLLATVGLGITLVVVMKMGVIGAQLNDLIGAVLFFLVSFLLFNRKRYTYRFSWRWGKKMLQYGGPLIFAGMAVWFLSAADRYILLHYRSVEEVGLYSVGNKLTQVMTLLAMAVQMSYGPLVISRFESDVSPEKTETKNFLSRSWRLFIVAAVSISVFLSVFGYEIIRVLAPPAYLTAILVIPFLTISKVLNQSVQMTSSGIELFQKTKHFSWIIPLVAGITIALNFLFIPILGFIGASIVSLIGNSIQLLISYNISQHYFRVNRRAGYVVCYLVISLLLAILCPISEIYLNFHPPLFAKLLVFLGSLTLPVLTGVVKPDTYMSVPGYLAVKFHELRKPER